MRKILFVLLLSMACTMIQAQSNAYADKNKCYITAQSFVKAKLKFPKEAKFDKNVVHETNGSGNAIILGKVTSKNAFGVQSEYVYKIWIKHNGKDWAEIRNWSMTKLILENPSTGEQSVF